jgi:hypothetical protein
LVEIIIPVGVCAFFWFLFLDWGDSVIHFDGWKGYNGTVDFGYKKHFRILLI